MADSASSNSSFTPRRPLQYLSVYGRGLAMGAADVVPGVSGGTIAFISGIYEELIDSLKSIEPRLLPMLFKEGPGAVWQTVNGNFLLALFLGIFTSIFTLAKAISYLLAEYPILIWCFFFGLIAASALLLWRKLDEHRWQHWLVLALGAALAYGLSVLSPGQSEASYPMLFMGGAIAVCAMILPGISGGFILLMMGLYGAVIDAIKGFDVLSLATVALGAGLGLIAFSHILSWLLHRYHAVTLALLTGFLFGSLNLIWPWKQVLTTRLNSQGQEVPLLQQNILPWQYETMTGSSANLILGCCFCAIGLVGVMVLEKYASKRQNG